MQLISSSRVQLSVFADEKPWWGLVGRGCDEWCTKSVYICWWFLSLTIFYGSTKNRDKWYYGGSSNGVHHFVSPDGTATALVPPSALTWWDEESEGHPPIVTAGWIAEHNTSIERLLEDDDVR